MKLKINTQIILDFCISAFFIFFSMTVIRLFIPVGFTSKFIFLGSKLIGMIFIVLIIIFLISWFFDKNFKFKKKFNFPQLKDTILLILPLSPVIDYALINNEYLNLNGYFYLIGITLTFILFFTFIFPVLFSFIASFKTLMFAGLALSFIILNMAKISSNHNPGDTLFNSYFWIQGAYLTVLFGVLYFLYHLRKDIVYISVILFVITGIVINFFNYSFNSSTKTKEKKSDRLINFLNNQNNKIIKKKNIYILVYESYAGLETLNHYGFDNSEQMNFLKKNGFEIYHGIYSNSAISIGTTSRILEIDGNISVNGRHYTSGNAFGLDILKANGYKTLSIFKNSYFFRSPSIGWDEYYPKEDITKLGGKTLTKAIFEGQFRFDIFDDNNDYENYLNLKKKYLNSSKENTFFWTHNGYPNHSTNSGKCRINENKKYFERMEKANKEMKDDVLNILNNDKNSIIVLLSDHGPYLTKNCTILKDYEIKEIDKFDIQDRYGTFLSIYWPDDIINADQNIVIIQDILPAILSNITNNRDLFNQLKIERKLFDGFNNIVGGVNVYNGIIQGGKDDGKPLFDKRSYNLLN